MTGKDFEQDAQIRQNAEHIRRNEEAILRQTQCLEKIRDHYFPKKTLWKSVCTYFVKVVGAIALYAGIMESGGWYLNTRKTDAMAAESAAVARRLFLQENDVAGSLAFLDKAIELDSSTVSYRILRTYVKGIAALVDFFDLGRPLSADERKRVDAIFAEAMFLREVDPDNPMSRVLAAQVYLLRDQPDFAAKAIAEAVELAPESAIVRVHACAVESELGNPEKAKAEIDEAGRLDPDLVLVHYWRGQLAIDKDDWATAKACFDKMLRIAPKMAVAHIMVGRVHMFGPDKDYAAARSEFEQALSTVPTIWKARILIAETYLREGNRTMARLWIERTLALNPLNMDALTARARMKGEDGEHASALEDWSEAIRLAPFRADLYRSRSAAHKACGHAREAEADANTAAALENEAKARKARLR